ncbi:anaerobic sulfite reductase subunit C [Salmonella enterica]|nr:anaerobic sulfite reductase subunit C [Salmonella enterica]
MVSLVNHYSGYLRFKERVLRGVQLNPEAMVAERIYWAEDESVARMHLKPAGH